MTRAIVDQYGSAASRRYRARLKLIEVALLLNGEDAVRLPMPNSLPLVPCSGLHPIGTHSIERETTGEPYVEGNMELDKGASHDSSSVEDLDAVTDDTPDSLTTDSSKADDAADSVSVRRDDDAPDSPP